MRNEANSPKPTYVRNSQGLAEATGPIAGHVRSGRRQSAHSHCLSKKLKVEQRRMAHSQTHVLSIEVNVPSPTPVKTLPSTWADARAEHESTARVRGGRPEATACQLETFPSAWADTRAELESTARGEPASHCLPRPLNDLLGAKAASTDCWTTEEQSSAISGSRENPTVELPNECWVSKGKRQGGLGHARFLYLWLWSAGWVWDRGQYTVLSSSTLRYAIKKRKAYW